MSFFQVDKYDKKKILIVISLKHSKLNYRDTIIMFKESLKQTVFKFFPGV